MTTHEKIDDDDGHYIVTEDMPIGDRCEIFFEIADPQHRRGADYLQIKSIDF